MSLHPGPEKRRLLDAVPAELNPIQWALHNNQENQDWYEELLERSQDLLCIHDLQGWLLSANPGAARALGYTIEQLLRIPMRQIVAPEHREHFDAYLAEIQRSGEARGYLAVLTRSGERRIWQYHNTLRPNGVGIPIVRGMAHDVTDVVREQKALRISHEQLVKKSEEQERMLREISLFRTLLDNSNDAIQVVEPETLRLLDMNHRTCSKLGYTREELLGMTLYDLCPSFDRKMRADVAEQIKASGSAVMERNLRRKDGTEFPVEVNLREVNLDRVYLVAVSREITARRQAEETLRQRDADFNRSQAAAHIGSWRVELQEEKVWLSDEAYRIVGLPVGSLLVPADARQKIFPDDLPLLTARWSEALRTGLFQCEHRILVGEKVRWVRSLAQFECDSAGLPLLGLGTVQDITESKQAATLLENHESRFHAMFDHSPVGIALIETDTGRIVQVNAQYCEIVGRTEADILSRDFQSFTHPDDLPQDLELKRQFAAGEIAHFEVEKRYILPDESQRWVKKSVVAAWSRSRRPSCHLAMIEDLTESRRAQDLLREFERVVENLEEMIAVVDRQYRCTLVNQSFLRYWQTTSNQVMGHFVQDMVPPETSAIMAEKLEACFRGSVVKYEMSVENPAMGWRHLAITCSPVIGPTGIERAACVLRDITQQKLSEQALHESESRERARSRELETVLDAVPVAVCIGHDPKCLLITGNWAAYEQMGVPPGSNISRGALESERPPFRVLENGVEVAPHLLPIQQAASTGKPVYHRPLTLVLQDGSVKETIASVVPLFDEDGKPRGAVAASIDITELKKTEASLRASENRFRTLYQKSPFGIAVVESTEGRFLHLNPSFCELVGRTEAELQKLTVRSITHPDDFGKGSAELPKLLAGQAGHFEIDKRYVRPDGSLRWVKVLVAPLYEKDDPERRLYVAMVEDITRRKLAEDALRDSEARFRTLYDSSPLGIAVLDAQSGRFLQMNSRVCEITGRSEAELLQVSCDAITHPADVAKTVEFRMALSQSSAASREYEKRFLRPDGSIRWMRVSAAALWAGKGDSASYVALSQDITDLKRAQLDLRLSEDRYQSIISAMSEGIVFHDASGKVLTWNDSAQRILGWGKDMEGRTSTDANIRAIHEDGSPFPGETHPAMLTLRTGQPLSNVVMGVHRSEDHNLTWISINSIPIFHSGEEHPYAVVASFTDITEQKSAQDAVSKLAQVRADSSESFFHSMAVQLSQCLDADYVIIAETIEGEENKMQTLAFTDHGVIQGNFVRELKDSVCQHILANGARSFPMGVTTAFPKDSSLLDLKAEGYAGTPLIDLRGRIVGMMCAIYQSRLTKPKYAESILRLFSTRTAAEIERKRTEEALRTTEEHFRVALKHAPIAVFSQDRDLRYTWINDQQLFFPAGEIPGKHPSDGLEPAEAERIARLRRRVIETGVGCRHEMHYIRDGKRYYLDATIEPLFDSSGGVIGLTGACMDVTDLRLAADALREAQSKLTEEKLYLEQAISTELGFGEIIGRSAALKEVMDKVAKVAPSNATVLLLGETGTGKELVARALHRMSQRKNNSFIKLNCAAIPSGLVESELFGHERGAFTGAVAKKIGRLELADQGTLFLDEIGEIPLDLQPKLLRVLQDHEFERLGGTQTLKVNFRLVAATNRDLLQSVNRREFRSDLYYRLHVFPIYTPALRERREDIPLLVEHFVRKCSARMGKSITIIPSKMMQALVRWPWPGNIRELENFIERSVILTPGAVLQVPLTELSEPSGGNADTLGGNERSHILRVLRECKGQLGGPFGAAARLGLKRTTLQSKLMNLGIDPGQFREKD